MLFEQLFAYGGSERQIDYEPTPGLLTCVDHPTAVSGGILQVIPMMNAVQAVLSRMMACASGVFCSRWSRFTSMPLAVARATGAGAATASGATTSRTISKRSEDYPCDWTPTIHRHSSRHAAKCT